MSNVICVVHIVIKKKFTKCRIRAKGGKTELKPFSLQSEFSHRHLKFEVKVSVVSS